MAARSAISRRLRLPDILGGAARRGDPPSPNRREETDPMRNFPSAAIIVLALCGCGKSGVAPAIRELPITGKVTLDGMPLPGADVLFLTASDPPAVLAAKTKDDGSYQLQTAARQEAPLQGNCKVTISRLVKPDGSPLAAEEMPADAGAVEQLPAKYSRFDISTLSAIVAAEGATIDFPLTSR
jgi:hypothetical protein